ncbi:MAG TPA: hypothetical protein VLT87_01790 [Thermoanaerobaculia bacterium]|nr:hypothetical protein [Thermoanaerobaculia bacterium]
MAILNMISKDDRAGEQNGNEVLSAEARDFYRRAMTTLQEERLPFLVGGAYAYARYTGVVRHTKDFDIFVRPRDYDRTLAIFEKMGLKVERSFAHWLGKGYLGEYFVDVIFGSGNGVARVDDLWFEHAVDEEVLDTPAKLIPAEEMIWSKSFIMERERYDGADVAHLLLHSAENLDWQRLLYRFGSNGDWRVLLSHLTLFGYIYPGEAHRIPESVLETLTERLKRREDGEPTENRLCRGTILSRSQYLIDVEQGGFQDARLRPVGNMSPEEIEFWTEAAKIDGPDAQNAQKK